MGGRPGYEVSVSVLAAILPLGGLYYTVATSSQSLRLTLLILPFQLIYTYNV